MKGNQIPRIGIEPVSYSTDGAGAAMLMQAYGVKLDEWQKLVVDCWLSKTENGGNPPQTGIRENPVFKGYINLWRAYMVGLEKYTSYLPKDLQGEATGDGLTTLDQVKQMRKVSA